MRDLAIVAAVLVLALALVVILFRPVRGSRTTGFDVAPLDSDPAAPLERTAKVAARTPERVGPKVELPMQVVVVDAPGGKAKASSPSDPHPFYGDPRRAGQQTIEQPGQRTIEQPGQRTIEQPGQQTIEDEWIELVGISGQHGGSGHPGSEWRPAPPARANARWGRERLGEARGPWEPAPPGEGAMDIRAGASASEDEPIFKELVSAWFQERRLVPVTPGTVPASTPDDTTTPPAGMPAVVGATVAGPWPDAAGTPTDPFGMPSAVHHWESAADEGWQAAQSLRNPTTSGFTAAGLPKRQPRAQLVPGVPGGSRLAPVLGNGGPERSAEAVRGRLSSYQRGLREARHASPEWDDQGSVEDAWGRPGGEGTE